MTTGKLSGHPMMLSKLKGGAESATLVDNPAFVLSPATDPRREGNLVGGRGVRGGGVGPGEEKLLFLEINSRCAAVPTTSSSNSLPPPPAPRPRPGTAIRSPKPRWEPSPLLRRSRQRPSDQVNGR